MTPLRPPALLEGVPLAPHTTLHLGGPAHYFLPVRSVEELTSGLAFAADEGLPVLILGGGSNVVVADKGFAGIVLRIELRGKSFDGDRDTVSVTAAAGEPWDAFVSECVGRGLAGLECLSGIPGLVGATPIQNVGAYGQEVGDTIRSVRVLERESLTLRDIPGDACGFAYRTSRFKTSDAARFVVVGVTFRLDASGRTSVQYPELERALQAQPGFDPRQTGTGALQTVRDVVLSLRRSKSMVVDPADPNTRSVGSFFLNPVLSEDGYLALQERWRSAGGGGAIPWFPSGGKKKIPAAWLVERAGFERGFRMGRAGISSHHALALVNHNGTTAELLHLAETIERRVEEVFALRLGREPVMVD